LKATDGCIFENVAEIKGMWLGHQLSAIRPFYLSLHTDICRITVNMPIMHNNFGELKMFWKNLIVDLIGFVTLIGCCALFIFYCWLLVG